MTVSHLVFAVFGLPNWLTRLRSFSLILVGVADNSVIPAPGSMDVLTIWLAASRPDFWLFYAIVATASAVFGGWITYQLARKGGKDAIQRRFSKRRSEKVFRRFDRWGFWAVAVPAVLPPPFPIVPFLLSAGALQYSPKKFLGALALGRAVRFLILAWLGVKYGTWVVAFAGQYYKPAIGTLVGLSLISGVFAYVQYKKSQRN